VGILLVVLKGGERVAIETIQSVDRSDPHHTEVVLQNAGYISVRQPLFDRVMVESQSAGGRFGPNQAEPCPQKNHA
jgi:hypothetical protein